MFRLALTRSCCARPDMATKAKERTQTLTELTPNVEGNRRAALAVTEDQGMNRRVRLTVGLGRYLRRFQ
ncbi:MAG: hypothetical protein ACRD9W_21565 [Terriglobia bacterium]